MKKIIQLLLLGATIVGFSACHTAAGLGRDLEEVGEEVQEASHRVHN